MEARNITPEQMQQGLVILNKKYEGNIVFKRFDVKRNSIKFTLTVKDSHGKGGRLGFSGRRVAAACWHVHCDMFDALLSLAPEARIVSNMATITRQSGNWQDRNIGSIIEPLMYSDACECH